MYNSFDLLFFLGSLVWDFQAVVGTGQRASLMTPADHPEIPWTAFVILALSTNVWYYATNQYINQRCLAAKNEWHAKMGVLLAGGLQVLMPLATCFPAMVYYSQGNDLRQPLALVVSLRDQLGRPLLLLLVRHSHRRSHEHGTCPIQGPLRW